MMGGLAAQSVLAVICLAGVLLLIVVGGRAAKALPGLRLPAADGGAVALRGSLALDRGRRLHLVQAGGAQVLVLTGSASDVMISLPGSAA